MHIKRRTLVKSAIYGGAVMAAWQILVQQALAEKTVIQHFPHGVASGDPTAHSVVIWSRITSQNPAANVIWQVSEAPEFSTLVTSGTATTSAAQDFSLKVDVTGLQPGKVYFYRFISQGVYSEPGRTKTLPVGQLNKIGFALASCSNYSWGYFNAYEAIARDEAIDFVIHLGDYIYEYGQNEWGDDVGKRLDRQHWPKHEIVSLEDYRLRHAQYKADHHSRLMHASHPLIVIWDDHESANNPYTQGAQNHQPEKEGDWAKRRDASLQAYYEWMPVREPTTNNNRAALWRAFSFGDLATLLTLETRHTGRAKQIDYADHLAKIASNADLDHFKKNILGAKNRDMLSADMQAFATNALTASKNKKQPWQLVANQIPMARTLVPQIPDSATPKENTTPSISVQRAEFKRLGELGLPMYLDTWDGYPQARQHFYELCQKSGVEDLIVFTGDSHSFWLNQLRDDQGKSMGVELGTSSISSPGDFEEFGPQIAKLMDQLLIERNTEIDWTDGLHRGYVRVQLTPQKAQVDYIAVNTVQSLHYTTHILKSAILKKLGKNLTVHA